MDIDDEIAELDRSEAEEDRFLDSISGDYSIMNSISHRFQQVVDWVGGGHKSQEQFVQERNWETSHGYPYLDD